MNPAELSDQVKTIILQQVGAFTHKSDLALLSSEALLDGPALGYDSFDRIELAMALEEALALDEVADEVHLKWNTVGHVVRYCQDAVRDKEQKEAE